MVQRTNGRAVSRDTGTDDIGWPSENAQSEPPRERKKVERSIVKEPIVHTAHAEDTAIPSADGEKVAEYAGPTADPQPAELRTIGFSPALCAPYTSAIYKSLHAIHLGIVVLGISKDRKNEKQGFKFRGIDDVYAALAPLLVENNVVTVPRMLERSVVQYNSKNGGTMFNVAVKAEYDFLSTIDGSRVTAAVFGEGMDSADKATAKAMAVAHKYAHFQLFNIPLEANPELRDPDFESPEITPDKPTSSSRPAAATSRRPAEKASKKEEAQLHPVEAAICDLLSTDEAREKLRNKVLDAYGVMLLKDIAEDDVDEAVQKVQDCVNAAKKRSASKE